MKYPGLGSTYRIQVQSLGFDQTRRLVPYLAELGVQTLYLSPIFAAAPGSTHGYDVIDPGRLDSALGSEAAFDALLEDLRGHGMSALLDIVPNHMAAVRENTWWWDVLRHGPESEHAPVFDIRWSEQHGRVLVPVLGRPLADVIAADALEVDVAREDISVDGIRFPLAAPAGPDDEPAALLRRQHYRPAYWRASATQGNYRRFFDINSLIGVRVEDPDVFASTHAFITRLTEHPAVAGVRVDHVDGLTDPAQYLTRLRSSVPNEKTVVVEKILGHTELVAPNWPIEGTSGYEFADHVMAMFIEPEAAARLRSFGETFCDLDDARFAALTSQGKREVLEQSFSAELDHLTRLSVDALDVESPGHDLAEIDIRRAWTALTTNLAVYRTYIDEQGASDTDRAYIEAAAAATRPEEPETRRATETLRCALTEQARSGSPWLVVARRWQQLSGAAMAKGCEDTATYRYPGLLARADVGGDPDLGGDGIERFHELVSERPSGLNATSTHDSKRNEDARCRLAVLSEVDSDWMTLVQKWKESLQKGGVAPNPVEQLAIFQSLLCLWPANGDPPDDETLERVIGQAIKSARESGLCSSWIEPDEAYEEGLAHFVSNLRHDTQFQRDMADFIQRIGPAAFANSLASVALKICSPGVPDFYQGTELADPSLTDPDNRRPVDFRALEGALSTLPRASIRAAHELLAHWQDGRLKLYAIRALLHDRKKCADFYARGSYEPLETTTRHTVAFRREMEGAGSLICVIPRVTYHLAGPGSFPTGPGTWKGATVKLGGRHPSRYHELLTDRTLDLDPDASLSTVLEILPMAVLRSVA